MANKDFVVKNSLVVGDTATINGVQVDPSNAVSGQVLKFDGTKFAPASEGDISGTVYTATIGDGTNSSYTITHGFATRNVVVVIRNAASPYEVINARWEATTTNTITVDFSSPAASDSIIVSVYSTVTGISTGSSYYQTIGNGTDSSFTLTHGFNTRDVVVTARNATSPYEVINVRWEAETANTVVLDFSVAPSSSSVRVGVYATVSGTTAASIDDLSDVTITSSTTGDLLKWSGSAWVNASGYATLASPTFTGNVSGITKTMVGLGSVDNTADTAKPVSTAQQTALDLKANIASPTFTGNVSGITKTMVGLGSVDNTADTAKPVSTAQQTALDLKANLASPALTGTPTAPTANAATNTTQIATTAFVRAEVAALVNSAGSTLDTLGEIATALGNDANLSTTLTTSIGLKAPLASPTFTGTVTIPAGASISGFAPLASPALTGTPTAPTATANTNTTQVATTAFVTTAVAAATITELDDIGDVTISTTGAAPTYAIGDTGPAGGKIFITPSTVGNSTGKYFEVAPYLSPDITRTWATGANQSAGVTGAEGTAIGTGEQNTIDIVAQVGNFAATCAAAYCADYTYGGFSDWFLPSNNEITRLQASAASLGSFGTFETSARYWTSTEGPSYSGTYYPDAKGMGGGIGTGFDGGFKNSALFVRPVRSFTAEGISTSTATSGDILKWNGTAWVNDNALLAAKANIASPTFTGTPTLPTGTIATTQTAADSTTKVATTAFVTTADNLKANLASPTFTGTVTTSNLTVNGPLKITTALEIASVSATAATGTINIDFLSNPVVYYTANATANWTLNIRGNNTTTMNTVMSTGDVATVTFMAQQGATAYYPTVYQIDGTAVTPKWQGGTAPTSGNASSIDTYAVTVVKTAANTYTAFASQTKFA